LPWIVLILGFGTAPAIVYGTIHGFFPILVLVMGGVRDVDRTLVTVARAFGASTWQLYWKVLLPAIVPTVLAGMRLGIVFSLLGVLIVEMFAGVRGMGYVMGSLANGFLAPGLFAGPAVVSVAIDAEGGSTALRRGWCGRRRRPGRRSFPGSGGGGRAPRCARRCRR